MVFRVNGKTVHLDTYLNYRSKHHTKSEDQAKSSEFVMQKHLEKVNLKVSVMRLVIF